MTIARMFDASVPPAEPYPGCAAVAGYIGGATPHVWTLEEWKRFGHLRQLPIWQAYGTPGAPRMQALAAANAMKGLGWRPYARARRVVVLDRETSKDAAFVAEFTAAIHPLGFGVWPYGSESTIFSLPAEDGYWVAKFDGNPADEWPTELVMAHQFEAEVPWQGGAVDLSVISAAALVHLGRGPRRAA